MRSFKKIVLMLAALLLTEFAAVFVLEPVTYEYFLDYDLKNLKKEGKEPDVVLIGDSRIYRSFVPDIFDRRFEDGSHCCVNAGTGSQTIMGSYYYLRDLTEIYPVRYVVMGLSHTGFMKRGDESALVELGVWDRIKSLPVKLEYLIEAFPVRELPYLLKSYRYRGNAEDVLETLRFKLSAETRSGVDTREGEHYGDRGFVWSESGFEDGGTGLPPSAPIQWEEDNIDEEAFLWLDRIRELCARKDIKLIFVTGPTTLSMIYSIEDYEGSFRAFQSYAGRYEIPYFELNLLKNRTEVLPDSMMMDSDHVCGAGAERTTEIFCDLWNRYCAGEDIGGCFYGSVKEMKRDIHAVVACDFHTEPVEGGPDRVCLAQSLQEDGAAAEYEFWIAGQDGVWELLQPYSGADRCVISGKWFEEPVTMRVNARLYGSDAEREAFMERSRRPEDE